MIRVLQCVNNMHRAGLETMLMNYYRNIDRTKIQFDFLVHRQERSDYDDEIESLGGRIYRAPRLYPQNYPAYFAYMKRFFREHPEYKIMHSHIDSMSFMPLLAGKIAGVPIRIAHSHNTSIELDAKYPLKQIFRYLIPTVTTHNLACGEAAGQFLFRGKDFQVIPNAIVASSFAFDPDLRQKKRMELKLKESFVLGHVGRLCKQKNHKFLIDVFKKVVEKEKNAVLLLVGTGEQESQIHEQIDGLGLSKSVHFLGKRSDVNEIYQVMDVFVMPSLFEGVPVVGIEAQFAGLPCVFSDRIPKEVGFVKSCAFLSLEEDVEYWAEHILNYRDNIRKSCESEDIMFDIKHARNQLEAYYENLKMI